MSYFTHQLGSDFDTCERMPDDPICQAANAPAAPFDILGALAKSVASIGSSFTPVTNAVAAITPSTSPYVPTKPKSTPSLLPVAIAGAAIYGLWRYSKKGR